MISLRYISFFVIVLVDFEPCWLRWAMSASMDAAECQFKCQDIILYYNSNFICIYLKRPIFFCGGLKIFEWCFDWIVMADGIDWIFREQMVQPCESNKLHFDILMKFISLSSVFFFFLENQQETKWNLLFNPQLSDLSFEHLLFYSTRMGFMIVFTVWIFYFD